MASLEAERKTESWIINAGRYGEFLLSEGQAWLATGQTPYWIHTEGNCARIEYRSQGLKPQMLTIPLGQLSPNIKSLEFVSHRGSVWANFKFILKQEKERYRLRVGNLGQAPVEVFSEDPHFLSHAPEQIEEPTSQPKPEKPEEFLEFQRSVLAMQVLARSWPFLTRQQIIDTSKRMEQLELKKGETFFKQNDEAEPPNDGMFLISQGKVDVFGEKDGEPIYIASIDSNSPTPYFGEIALINKAPRSATVVASEDTLAFRLDRKGFAELEASSPLVRKLVGLIVKIRSRQRVSPMDLAQAINLPRELHPAFSHWLDCFSQFQIMEDSSSSFYIQQSQNIEPSNRLFAAKYLITACGYLISEGLEEGKLATEITDSIQDHIQQAVKLCEQAGKIHEANTLKAIIRRDRQNPNTLGNIVTVLATQYKTRATA